MYNIGATVAISELIEVTVVSSNRCVDTQVGGPIVAGRTRKEARQPRLSPVKQPVGGTGVSKYRPGDLLLVRLSSDTAKQSPSVWIRVERCDEQHRIVFGTVDGESPGLGKALDCGAKLAAGYHQVHENASVVSLGRASYPHTRRK
jgi:hypothetical protein